MLYRISAVRKMLKRMPDFGLYLWWVLEVSLVLHCCWGPGVLALLGSLWPCASERDHSVPCCNRYTYLCLCITQNTLIKHTLCSLAYIFICFRVWTGLISQRMPLVNWLVVSHLMLLKFKGLVSSSLHWIFPYSLYLTTGRWDSTRIGCWDYSDCFRLSRNSLCLLMVFNTSYSRLYAIVGDHSGFPRTCVCWHCC